MADPTKVDWADALAGGLMGLLTGMASVFGWFSGRIGKVHERIDTVHARINTVTQTASDQAASIKVLEAHHDAKLQRLERIEDNLTAINEKQDRQMELLIDIRGRG